MRHAVVLALAVALAVPAFAQETLAPPPAAGSGDPGPVPLELLPDVGKIGAQVGLLVGTSHNPYGVGGGGISGAGYIVLPLGRGPRGRISYEIEIALSDGRSDPFFITNPVAIVANLAAGFDLEASLAGPPEAPFPARSEVQTELRALSVAPFGLRYSFDGWGRGRVRPYLVAGVDFVVFITKQEPLRDESLIFTGTSPFDDALIGGLIAQAPELAEQGNPTGQGNVELGGHAGIGFEFRLTPGVSLNAEYRYTLLSGDALQRAQAGLGFHW